ncbi:hypothetical protein Tco_1013670 [Tanacetum coccineum]
MSIKIEKITKEKELRQREQTTNLSTYTAEPSRSFNSIYYDNDMDEERTIPLNEIFSQIPSSIAITPVLPIEDSKDSLIMGGENFSTILEKELDEFIKSSVEDLVPIPSESEDTSDTECDLPSCDNPVTFSNPLFDSNNDFTSSDDESLPEEDVQEENCKIYTNPLFEFDDKYISSDALLVTHLSELNEDECFNPGSDEIEACLTSDSLPPEIDDADFDLEGDIFLLEKLLSDDTSSPLPPKVI